MHLIDSKKKLNFDILCKVDKKSSKKNRKNDLEKMINEHSIYL